MVGDENVKDKTETIDKSSCTQKQIIKHKVFISFHKKDRDQVDKFTDYFASKHEIFTPYVLGANDNDDFINSSDPDYVMGQIRKKYLKDTSVTIVLIGRCTHSRRYVDWEIKSSLTQGDGTPNGLIGVLLPGMEQAFLPPRFKSNWTRGHVNCYARYWPYPTSPEKLRSWINDAHSARLSRANLIKNPKDMMKNNVECKVCGVTH